MTRKTRPRCHAVRAQLPLFVGGDLDAPLARGFRAHLRDCHECRREAGAQLRAVRGLGGAVAASVVPGVDDALFVSLHEQVMDRVARTEPVAARLERHVWRRVTVAAAAAVLFVAGWLAARPDRGLLARTPIEATGVVFGGESEFRGPVLQQLGHDEDGPSGLLLGGGPGSAGLMGRLSLRTLEDELPPEILGGPGLVRDARSGVAPGRDARVGRQQATSVRASGR